MKKEQYARATRSSLNRKRPSHANFSSSNHLKQPMRKLRSKIVSKKKCAPTTSLHPQPTPNISCESQSLETTIDTPQFSNLEDYIQDIDQHILEEDQSFFTGFQKINNYTFGENITHEMRKILVKWLCKVAARFRIKSETLHLCVQIIDLMLIQQSSFFHRGNFQLLGVTAFFISSKYHEIYTLEADKYAQLCDGIFSTSQLLEMQGLILLELGFNLQIPTLPQLIKPILRKYFFTNSTQKLVYSLLDCCLMDFNLLNGRKKSDVCLIIAYITTKFLEMKDEKKLISIELSQMADVESCYILIMSLVEKNSSTFTYF